MEQLNRIELRGVVGFTRLQSFNDTRMLSFSLATNHAYKDRDGNAVIDTSWHNVVAWEGRGIQDLDKITKGSKVYVQGRIRYQKYTGNDGIERYSTEVFANRLVIIEDPEPLQYEM